MIIDYNTSEDFITEDGIKVLKIGKWNKGPRVIRSFTHRLPQLYKSLKAQKADVYYCRIRDFRHILSFWAARKVKAKFVLGLASDLDAMGFSKRLKYYYLLSPGSLWSFSSGLLIEIIQPFLLRNADLVISQHEVQKNYLQKRGIASIVLPNLIDCFEKPTFPDEPPKDYIYVGRLDKRKGFTEFFELIQKSPSQTFKLVGQPRDKAARFYFDKLKEFSNVTLWGRLSHSETLNLIMNSKALISTSQMEGFPNVFIEAWACGIPVLSLYIDPGVIEKEKLGQVFNGNLNQLSKAVQDFHKSREFSSKARLYVEQNHLLNTNKIESIKNLFNNLAK